MSQTGMTHLGFRAHTVAAVNPDVLGQDFTLLVQLHVFQELSSCQRSLLCVRGLGTHVGGVGDCS